MRNSHLLEERLEGMGGHGEDRARHDLSLSHEPTEQYRDITRWAALQKRMRPATEGVSRQAYGDCSPLTIPACERITK